MFPSLARGSALGATLPGLATLLLVCTFSVGCIAVPLPHKGYPHMTITGVVIDKANGVPLADATVRFQYRPSEVPRMELETRPDGSFIIQPERQWRYYYKLFTLGEMPVFSTLVVEKDGYETARIKWLLSRQLGWMWNYRISNYVEDLGRIELALSDEESVTEYFAAPETTSLDDPKLIKIEKPPGWETDK
jgi:hypothetical protein